MGGLDPCFGEGGQCGVRIDLVVGACMLAAQVPGLTDNIRVRSVIGRFLEHTRVFYFRVAQQKTCTFPVPTG